MQKHDINILFLRPVLNAYGASKVLLQVASELKNRGYNIVFASDNQDRFKSHVEKMGFRHYVVPLRGDRKNIISFLICFIKIIQITRKEKIKIIHSHHRWSSFISYFVSKLFKIPLVTTYHGIHEGNKSVTLWGDKIISVSEDAKNHLINYFKVNPNHIEVIHNGIKISEQNTKKQVSNISNYPVIASISRLSPEKDLITLFHAMKTVLKKYPHVQLLIVGNGPLDNKLKILAKEINISKNVDFIGEIDDVSVILKRIDFLVLSSLTEGLPISVLEALSFEKPVVATSVGDVPAVVLDGKTGYLVPPKDPKKLADAMNLLLSNRGKAVEMGKNGRELVQDKFSVEQMVIKNEKLYLELLSSYK